MGRRGEGGMEMGEEGRIYIYGYTVTTRMTFALRWATMRAILIFHYFFIFLPGSDATDINYVHASTKDVIQPVGPSGKALGW